MRVVRFLFLSILFCLSFALTGRGGESGLPDGVLFRMASPSLFHLSQSAVRFGEGISPDTAGKLAVITTGLMLNPQTAALNMSSPVGFYILQEENALLPVFTAELRPGGKSAQVKEIFTQPVRPLSLPDGRYAFVTEEPGERASRMALTLRNSFIIRALSQMPPPAKSSSGALSLTFSPKRLMNSRRFLATASSILFRHGNAGSQETLSRLKECCGEIERLSVRLTFPEQTVAHISGELIPSRGSMLQETLRETVRPMSGIQSFSSADTFLSVTLPDSVRLRQFLRLFPEDPVFSEIVSHSTGRVYLSQNTAVWKKPVIKAEIEMNQNAAALLDGFSKNEDFDLRKQSSGLYRAGGDFRTMPLYLKPSGNRIILVTAAGMTPKQAQSLISDSVRTLPLMIRNAYVCGFRKKGNTFRKYFEIIPKQGLLSYFITVSASDFPADPSREEP